LYGPRCAPPTSFNGPNAGLIIADLDNSNTTGVTGPAGAEFDAGPRFVDGVNYTDAGTPDPFTGAVPDIGAYEADAQIPAPATCVGDLTGDGVTDVFDFAVFANNFGQNVAPNTGGDLDGNGVVDVFVFAGDFGCSGSS
jgi:hypothetical protein